MRGSIMLENQIQENAVNTVSAPLTKKERKAQKKAEKAELTEKLSRKFNRSIHLECAVDPSLLGGLVVQIDGKVIDGSLKHRLHEIKEVMNR